jgi:4-hydroxybenzoate polyprenyltransferase
MMEPDKEKPPVITDARDLYVDIDGTLLRTDLLHEAAWRYVKKAPWRVLELIRLALRGPAPLKTFLARKTSFDPAALPYEEAMIALIRERKGAGKRTILITASHRKYARRIAAHLGLNDAAHGSSNRHNLKGVAKLSRIRSLNGGREFIYAGNSTADRPIWAASEKEILVNAPLKDVQAAIKSGRAEMVVKTRPPIWRAFLKEMRLHQWAKNTLIFVPLFTSHTYNNSHLLVLALLAFVAFGLCASGHYFLNDLLDLDADRIHRTKRSRPLASGNLPLLYGPLGAFFLPLAGLVMSASLLPLKFTLMLLAYLALTNFYSFSLKSRSTADVFALAMLYTIRVVAGGVVLAIPLSSWILAYSMFVFISLAYLKRYIEVGVLAQGQAKGRGYSKDDAETVFTLGVANATAATVVLAFYISSPEVKAMYREPNILWLLCLLMLYWCNRIWIGARRGKIHDDPVIFAIKDGISRTILFAMVAVVLVARFIGPL